MGCQQDSEFDSASFMKTQAEKTHIHSTAGAVSLQAAHWPPTREVYHAPLVLSSLSCQMTNSSWSDLLNTIFHVYAAHTDMVIPRCACRQTLSMADVS